MKYIGALFLFTLLSTSLLAQFKIDADLRARYEYRHGFRTLFPDNAEAASFISQRSRLKFSYQSDKVDFFVSAQDVRVWGNTVQLNTTDPSGIWLHEGWGKIKFTPSLSLKVGRQELNYDDARILGNVDWVMQARSHDAAVFLFEKNAWKIHVGGAYNQTAEGLLNNAYTLKNYKTMQYAWFNRSWESFKASVLVLNNGLQYTNPNDASKYEIRFSQTYGTHLKWNKGAFGLIGNAYYQLGEDVAGAHVNAYNGSLEANYKKEKWNAGLGYELLSGDNTNTTRTNESFTPFYGTNHKFNGLMDYFYVGNHIGGPGLQDIYVKAGVKIKSKAAISMAFHNFSVAADFAPNTSRYLGNELDVVVAYPLNPSVVFKAGYSQLWAEKGMEVLKASADGNVNNWGWVMVVVKPNLFNSENLKKDE